MVYTSLAIGRACHMTYGSFMPTSMPAELLTITSVVLNLLAVVFGSLITHASVGIIMYEAGIDNFEVVWKKHVRPYFSVMPQGLGFMGRDILYTNLQTLFLSTYLVIIRS